jgi:hypothetical protein
MSTTPVVVARAHLPAPASLLPVLPLASVAELARITDEGDSAALRRTARAAPPSGLRPARAGAPGWRAGGRLSLVRLRLLLPIARRRPEPVDSATRRLRQSQVSKLLTGRSSCPTHSKLLAPGMVQLRPAARRRRYVP